MESKEKLEKSCVKTDGIMRVLAKGGRILAIPLRDFQGRVRKFKQGRHCQKCGKILSRYNPGEECFCHKIT